MILELYIPAIPVAQPRARAVNRGGHAGVFNPTTIKQADGTNKPHPIAAFKATLKHAAAAKYTAAPLQTPLYLSAVFVFPRPGRMIWKKRPMPRARHTIKPDRDNLDKAVLDALKGIVFADDCQVCAGMIEKYYAAGDEQPHVEIRVIELAEQLESESVNGEKPDRQLSLIGE